MRAPGWDVVHVGEIGMQRALDREIAARAIADGRAVVTLDSDFSAFLALTGAVAPSVIHARLQGLDTDAAVALLSRLVPSILSDLEGGCVASVTASSVRVRALPIRG